MKKKWALHPEEIKAGEIARELKVHRSIASILLRRGYRTSAEIFNFLNPSTNSLEDPFVFTDMAKVVERIRRAVAAVEKILIYGDYDVDGVTGSAILFQALKKLGADVRVHIPHRIHDGYGLNVDSLAKLLTEGFTLVITVDNGITSVDPVRYLADRGVDVIIVDHHTLKDDLPPAYAIVCAHAGDKKGDPHLAACGLAFKLAWALLGSYEAAEEYLDLTALGTVADIAPVVGDNRFLLRKGMQLLSSARRPGIRALMRVAKIPAGALSTRDLAFSFAPRINAAGRMGSPLNAFKLLTTEDPQEAMDLAKFLEQGNRDRQKIEAEAFKEAIEMAEELSSRNEDSVLILDSEGWHEGVIGIVAARLVERYHKPAIVISLKGELGKGSGRSVPGFSIFGAVEPHEELLVNFGGHAQAVGLTVKKEAVGEFRRRVNEGIKSGGIEPLKPDLFIEDEMNLNELDTDFLRDLTRLEPFGPGNPKPFFLSKGVKVKGEARIRGKDTLCLWLTGADGRMTCEAVGFRMFGRWEAEKKTDRLDIVYRPALVEYRGITSIQLELEDWRISNSSSEL